MRLTLLVLAALLATAAPAAAHPVPNGLPLPLGGPPEKTVASTAQVQPQPAPVPRPDCGPGSRPETDIQGRVPAGNPEGFTCNTTLVGHHGSSGGYKALRFKDKAGRECAYYDTTLLFPTNVQTLSERPTGVAVLDMSDPANPKQTASLVTPAMQTPHESLLLNERRGLLAAVTGNPAFYPGIVDVYDLNEDCRNPALQSSLPVGIFGHESGFAPDGNTFYATSISTGNITAVDLSNPKVPMILATTNYNSHGLTISDDGNRAYVAASQGLFILDTSEIQARKQGAAFKEVSKLDWPERTIPQVAQPITIGGRPYLAEIDEFSSAEDDDSVAANGPKVGAARIIDIADERNPKVVSNIRLAVHQRENRAKIGGDPGAQSFVQGYAGHYCNVPRRDGPGDPRLLDDRERPADLRHPRPAQPARDGLLRRAEQDEPERGRAEQLRDVEPRVRARAQRGLVHGRQLRLLRRQARRLAVRDRRGRGGLGRLHRRRRLPLGVGDAEGPPRAAGLHAPARGGGEDRGLPGLPGPADRQGAAGRALHQAGDVEREGPRTATTSRASRWPAATCGGSCCASRAGSSARSPATTAAATASCCARSSCGGPCSAAARARRCGSPTGSRAPRA